MDESLLLSPPDSGGDLTYAVIFRIAGFNRYAVTIFSQFSFAFFMFFDALEFIALVTAHIPPKHKQLIRRYGLYASRSRGKWDSQDHVIRLAPEGWKEKKKIEEATPAKSGEKESAVGTKKQRSTWAKLRCADAPGQR